MSHESTKKIISLNDSTSTFLQPFMVTDHKAGEEGKGV